MIETTNQLLPCLKVVYEYANLESQVRRLLNRFCSPHCSDCIDCCCKEKFCNESLGSFWLNMVWQNSGYDLSQYNAGSGWLTCDGCRLVAGRPPVCYSFICKEILKNPSQSDHLQIMVNIAKLMPLVGKNAIGNKHLVTLSAQEVLEHLNFTKLSALIAKCLKLFEQYEKELNDNLIRKMKFITQRYK